MREGERVESCAKKGIAAEGGGEEAREVGEEGVGSRGKAVEEEVLELGY